MLKASGKVRVQRGVTTVPIDRFFNVAVLCDYQTIVYILLKNQMARCNRIGVIGEIVIPKKLNKLIPKS